MREAYQKHGAKLQQRKIRKQTLGEYVELSLRCKQLSVPLTNAAKCDFGLCRLRRQNAGGVAVLSDKLRHAGDSLSLQGINPFCAENGGGYPVAFNSRVSNRDVFCLVADQFFSQSSSSRNDVQALI